MASRRIRVTWPEVSSFKVSGQISYRGWTLSSCPRRGSLTSTPQRTPIRLLALGQHIFSLKHPERDSRPRIAALPTAPRRASLSTRPVPSSVGLVAVLTYTFVVLPRSPWCNGVHTWTSQLRVGRMHPAGGVDPTPRLPSRSPPGSSYLSGV